MSGDDESAVDAGTLAELLDGDDPPLVVDVRDPEPFAAGHVPGSENVPVDRLPGEIGSFDAEHVVLVCEHGAASEAATRLVRAAGMPADHLAGGLDAWSGPIETDGRPEN